MGNEQFQNQLITRVITAKAAAQATESETILDMEGFEGVRFIAKFDDVVSASVLTLQVQQDELNAGGGMATLTGNATHTAAGTDGDDNLLVLDLYRPLKRYIRVQVVIATQNAVLAGVIAIQYGARKRPQTQDATVLNSNQLTSPDEA